MKQLLVRFLRHMAMEHNRCVGLWRRLGRPTSPEWGQYVTRHGGLYSVGEHCTVNVGSQIQDPYLVRLGNNVRLGACILIGHDGSINMLMEAYGVKLDRVGMIDIRDNVFIGHNAIVLPGVTVGPNAIVGAGAVVAKDVGEGDIVVGNPARVVGRCEDLVKRWRSETEKLPWFELIEKREGGFDPAIEDTLRRMRQQYYFVDRPAQKAKAASEAAAKA